MDLEKRMRMAAEAILENEALRGGLDDSGASLLLEWGTQCAKQIAADTASLEDDLEAEESSYPRHKALRKMLGAVQKLYAPESDPAGRSELWGEIARQAPIVYAREAPGLADIQPGLLAALQNFESAEKIRMLRALIENNLS